MEEAAELGNYLPISFKSPKEQEYIEFLWDAFETNYTHGKHQFAFLAYHMLTMSFVYFNIWQIKQTEPKDFAMGLIGFGRDIEKSLLEAIRRPPRARGRGLKRLHGRARRRQSASPPARGDSPTAAWNVSPLLSAKSSGVKLTIVVRYDIILRTKLVRENQYSGSQISLESVRDEPFDLAHGERYM